MIFVIEALLWWGALIGVWVVTLSVPSWPEAWIATAAALPCALLTVRARKVLGEAWRLPPRDLRWLAPLTVAVLADTARVLTLRLSATRDRPRKSDFLRVRLPADRPGIPAATRRAVAAAVVSATPATVVVDSRPDEDVLVVHSLVSGPPDMTETVSR